MDAKNATVTDPFTEARRDMPSFLATAERRCLVWIADRLPGWVLSDHLTILALAAMFMAGMSYWAAQFGRGWLLGAVFWLGVNWFGDSLDGTLARVRRHERPRYGFYVDHVVDCFGMLFLVGGLGASPYMGGPVAMGLLIAYFLLSCEIYLATSCLKVFRIAFWGIGPTELRLLLAGGTLALRSDPQVRLSWGAWPLFDVGGTMAIVAIGITLLVSVGRNIRTLAAAEPLPASRGSRR